MTPEQILSAAKDGKRLQIGTRHGVERITKEKLMQRSIKWLIDNCERFRIEPEPNDRLTELQEDFDDLAKRYTGVTDLHTNNLQAQIKILAERVAELEDTK